MISTSHRSCLVLLTRSQFRIARKHVVAAVGGARNISRTSTMYYELNEDNHFAQRHIGPRKSDVQEMLKIVGANSLEELVEKTIPSSIRVSKNDLDLPKPVHEHAMLQELREIARQNKVFKSYIGMGYYGCITPSVLVRNMLENAGWITQYTPYQAEISQGRLESLMNFQTMVADLTGLHLANASLLDEATACAEAMTLCHRFHRKRNVFLVDSDMHLQNIALIQTRAEPLGIEVRVSPCDEMQVDKDVCGVIVQYPNTYGTICDHSELVQKIKQHGALFVMCTDLLACTLIKSPGECGADVAVGSAQRFGVPMGYGGPHAAFMSVRDDDNKHRLARLMPGRVVGVTSVAGTKEGTALVVKEGDPLQTTGYRLALQTREQHIRREKATSNICTAQALLANMAAMYAVYHGPSGLRSIADKVHRCALTVVELCKRYNKKVKVLNEGPFFDTLLIKVPNSIVVHERAVASELNLRYFDDGSIGIALDETVCVPELTILANVLCGNSLDCDIPEDEVAEVLTSAKSDLSTGQGPMSRQTPYLEHPVFNTYHSEQQLIRYMKSLENKDLSLTHSMIPLGSCTMKLNGSSQLIPITWPQFNAIHPFAPRYQTLGYYTMLAQLENWLCEITGYDHISFQPNSGAQGEYAGLLAIRNYHRSIDQSHRNICLIPDSAHGTNPASAQMIGYKIVIVTSDRTGGLDLADLEKKIAQNKGHIAAIMVTYPSTYGVFDENIQQVCDMVHKDGGQVYLDGANLNPQVGLCRPGDYGSDVSHLNLHKTFCIPHGGGGPGMGPIGVKSHLIPFLPSHPLVHLPGRHGPPVSAAPFGSASILPICWAYIRMMGKSGLVKASQISILNANYCMKRLEDSYRIEYRGKNGFVSHEFIMDCKNFKKNANVTVTDIAKRMMDYGFHAPTMSWPIADCLMMEPTESEDKAELDRFCDTMIAIRDEIGEIQRDEVPLDDNVLKNSPHTLRKVSMTEWPHSYSREKAVYPKPWCYKKQWPAVGRLDDAYGDKNLVCTCPPIESYA